MKRNLTFLTRKHSVLNAFLPAVLMLFSACEKVVDVNLKDVSPKIVIEANITDQPGPYQVLISRSVSFSDPNYFPAVTGAQVILSDNTGQIDTLTETAAGTYLSRKFQGVPGRNYFLQIRTGEILYSATSAMPQPMPIQEIAVENFEFNPEEKVVKIKFQDPPGVRNFYRASFIVNGVASDRLLYTDDEFNDGKIVEGTFIDEDLKLKSGDSVKVVLFTVDENVFRYLREQDRLSNGQPTTSPANPTSNFSNGAFGYFSAQAETSATVVVP
jgi:hypothetical protein